MSTKGKKLIPFSNEAIEDQIDAIGYIRQSDEREDKEDISEITQLKKIEQYCEFNGFSLIKVFKDIDYSGFRIAYTKRPGIMDALKFAKENPNIKKFVIFNLSRLTRLKQDFHHIHGALNSLSIDICSASEQVDFGSPTGRLVASILVDFNEYYSDNLSDVVIENKKTNAEKGRWNGGPAPYGLIKIDDGGFVEDELKGPYVRAAFSMAKEGKGPYLISGWLNEREVLTETGREWSPRRVRYMLTNPTYAGMQKWDNKLYPLHNTTKLVDFEDFEYIQSTLFGKEKVWKGKNRQLLSSVLVCPFCGSKMHSRKSNTSKGTRKYVCSKKNESGRCKCPNFDQPSLNKAVLKLIGNMAKKNYDRNDILPELSDKDHKDASTMKQLNKELNDLEQAEQKLFDAYFLHNQISEIQYENTIRRYGKRKKEIIDLLNKIPLPKSKSFGDLDDVIEEFAEAIDALPEEDKRRSIELLVEKIEPGEPTLVHFRWGDVKEIHPKSSTKYKSKLYLF